MTLFVQQVKINSLCDLFRELTVRKDRRLGSWGCKQQGWEQQWIRLAAHAEKFFCAGKQNIPMEQLNILGIN